MDPATLKSEPDASRKRRFTPKAPPRRVRKAEVTDEVAENADADQARDLLRRFNEGSTRAKPEVKKKVAASQVALGYGSASYSLRSFGVPKGGNRNFHGSPSTGRAFRSGMQVEKEYKEPWDYYSYYSSTLSLPLRRPYSENPELLDEEEFGADAETLNYDETLAKAAIELGLVEKDPKTSMFLLQLPPPMPLTKRSATTTDGQGATESSPAPVVVQATQKLCALNEVPAGLMGKMLVYGSGAIKLKIGDTLYDVSSGIDCGFAQDVVDVNNVEKHCCIVGELKKRATVIPDVDSILHGISFSSNIVLQF